MGVNTKSDRLEAGGHIEQGAEEPVFRGRSLKRCLTEKLPALVGPSRAPTLCFSWVYERELTTAAAGPAPYAAVLVPGGAGYVTRWIRGFRLGVCLSQCP